MDGSDLKADVSIATNATLSPRFTPITTTL
jgi:hypothetical protein